MNLEKQNELSDLRLEFWNNGFVLVKNLIDTKVIEEARTWLLGQDLEKLAKTFTDQEPLVPLAVYQYLQDSDNPIGNIVRHEKVLQSASELLGEPIYVWSSKINLKAAWYGTAEYYHQDYVYWKDRGYVKDKMLSCMVFMEPHGIHNGGLHVIPKSHSQGFIEHQSFININGLQKFTVPKIKMDELSSEYGLRVIEAEPGDALFFHANLIHGSAHNISNNSRMILLSQINAMSNLPKEVSEKARKFQLSRAKKEMEVAAERYSYFKKKYEEQLNSETLLFNSPIAAEEKTFT